jgi:hypothetical protein
MKLFHLDRFSKNIQKSNFIKKSVQFEPGCSMLTERRKEGLSEEQTDATKLIVAFRSFEKALKKI